MYPHFGIPKMYQSLNSQHELIHFVSIECFLQVWYRDGLDAGPIDRLAWSGTGICTSILKLCRLEVLYLSCFSKTMKQDVNMFLTCKLFVHVFCFYTFVLSMCLSLHWPQCFLAFSNFQLQFPAGSPFGSRGATAARLRTAPGCRVPFPKRPPPVCPPRSPRSRRDPRSSRHSLWRQMMKLCIMNQGTSRWWRCFITTKAKRL